MPEQTSFAIADGQLVPVTHTFTPLGVQQVGKEMVAKFMNRGSASIASGAERLTGYQVLKTTGGFSTRWRLSLPIVQTISGIPTVARTGNATLTLGFDPDSTEQERKDLRTMVRNALADGTQLSTSIDQALPIYG